MTTGIQIPMPTLRIPMGRKTLPDHLKLKRLVLFVNDAEAVKVNSFLSQLRSSVGLTEIKAPQVSEMPTKAEFPPATFVGYDSVPTPVIPEGIFAHMKEIEDEINTAIMRSSQRILTPVASTSKEEE